MRCRIVNEAEDHKKYAFMQGGESNSQDGFLGMKFHLCRLSFSQDRDDVGMNTFYLKYKVQVSM